MPKFSFARRAMETFVHSFRISVRLRAEEVGQDHVNRPEFQLARNGM